MRVFREFRVNLGVLVLGMGIGGGRMGREINGCLVDKNGCRWLKGRCGVLLVG